MNQAVTKALLKKADSGGELTPQESKVVESLRAQAAVQTQEEEHALDEATPDESSFPGGDVQAMPKEVQEMITVAGNIMSAGIGTVISGAVCRNPALYAVGSGGSLTLVASPESIAKVVNQLIEALS